MATPFRVSFHTDSTSKSLFAWETFTDTILLIDILVSLFSPYERIDGSYERNNMKIAKRYLRTYLIMDIIVILPT